MHIKGYEACLSFAKSLNSKEIPHCIALVGNDPFFSEEIEENLIHTISTKIGIIPAYFDQFSPLKISESLGQSDLFSMKGGSCVVVQKGSLIKSKSDFQALETIIRQLKNEYFILTGETLSENLRKLFESSGMLLEVEQIKPWEKERLVEKWIESKLKDSYILFEVGAPKKILEQLGYDRKLILSEIEKLSIYQNENEMIRIGEVQSIVTSISNATLSQLTQALLSKNVKRIVEVQSHVETQGIHALAGLKYLSQVLAKKFRESGDHHYFDGLIAIEEQTLAIRTGARDTDVSHELFLLKLADLLPFNG